jgi:SseB protein.
MAHQNADDDPLGTLIDRGTATAEAEERLLFALASGSILAALNQAPGAGAAELAQNLVEWQRKNGERIVPLFTAAARLPAPLPPPALLARVPVRILLASAGARHYVLNPLSAKSYEICKAVCARLISLIAALPGIPDVPSRDAPWAFRAPSDSLYPVAYALATWFVASGRVDEAFLYELLCPRSGEPPQVILALDEPKDPPLAAMLTEVAIEAGAAATAFRVRFLPDEPSHRAGIAGLGMGPFYRRPR